MEPIVSPWLIYVIETLKWGNIVVTIGLVVSTIIFLLIVGSMHSNELTRKNLWKPAVVVIIFAVISVILPSRETAYKMLMASYVTPNNIHMVGKEANEAVSVLLDNITNHMKELKDTK